MKRVSNNVRNINVVESVMNGGVSHEMELELRKDPQYWINLLCFITECTMPTPDNPNPNALRIHFNQNWKFMENCYQECTVQQFLQIRKLLAEKFPHSIAAPATLDTKLHQDAYNERGIAFLGAGHQKCDESNTILLALQTLDKAVEQKVLTDASEDVKQYIAFLSDQAQMKQTNVTPKQTTKLSNEQDGSKTNQYDALLAKHRKLENAYTFKTNQYDALLAKHKELKNAYSVIREGNARKNEYLSKQYQPTKYSNLNERQNNALTNNYLLQGGGQQLNPPSNVQQFQGTSSNFLNPQSRAPDRSSILSRTGARFVSNNQSNVQKQQDAHNNYHNEADSIYARFNNQRKGGNGQGGNYRT